MTPDPDLDTLDPRARPIVEGLVERKHANTYPVISRKECQRLLGGVSESKQIRLEKAGEILAYVSDGRVNIDADSVFDKLIRDAIASFPPGEPPAKVREVPTAFSAGPMSGVTARR
jgi:hypothetical protein